MSVVIETTLGDMTVDLFVEERPNTCLNFLKLCKIKYYNFCLFHTVQHNFIAQTGDPTGTGKNGESVYSKLYGEKAKYYEAEAVPKLKHSKTGLVSMVNCGNNMLGSQFFFTLSADLQSLDGQHCVFGEVVEGHDTLLKLNEAICDLDNRPYQDIRIKHTVILVDPYEDPPGLPLPDASPLPSAETLVNGRIGPDEQLDETQGMCAAEVEEMVRAREAKAQATILEIVGDIPDADIAPPENVLFVCKLNPVTSDDDLEIIFSRFGRVKSCEVIRDKKTGDSLQYAFVEFEDRKACEEAFLKMDNVLIDDRRIHVDFSQSVSKLRWKGKGRGVEHLDSKDEPSNHKYGDSRQRSPENYHKKEDSVQHKNGSGSPQVGSAELQQGSQRESPDPYPERNRKEESRERDRRDRSRNSERERDRYWSEHRTHSLERRRTDDSERSRRGNDKRRETSRERQRRSDDADRNRHRRDRKRDSDHERSRGDRTRNSDNERSRSDRAKESDRERSRSDRIRESDRERSRSDRLKDSEYDRGRSSRHAEDIDKSKGDKNVETKIKEVKKEHEEKNSTEKESIAKVEMGSNLDNQADEEKSSKGAVLEKSLVCEPSKLTENLSPNRKSEENVVNLKPVEETDRKMSLDKPKRGEKDIRNVDGGKQVSERHDKESIRGNKPKQEKVKDEVGQSDSEEETPQSIGASGRKSKLESGGNTHWQKKYQHEKVKKNRDVRGCMGGRTLVKKQVSESEDKSDEDVGSEVGGSESEHQDVGKKWSEKPSGSVNDRERHQNDETSHRKAKRETDSEDSQDTAGGDNVVPQSKKKQKEYVHAERVKIRSKRRAEQSPHSVKKKRWRKQSSSSDSEDSSSSDSSSGSSDSSSDSAKNSRSRAKKNLKKHVLPARKMKKLKMIKKKKRKLRRRKHSESDSSSESSDSSNYKRKYIQLKKKKKRKNISSGDSSSEDEARKRRERRKKSKQKKKPSSSEDSDEYSGSVSSDVSYQKLLKKHKRRLAAERKAKKSKRELKLGRKKNYASRKRQHSEPEEQSSSDESPPKIVKKDSKKSNGVEGKKGRKESVADVSS